MTDTPNPVSPNGINAPTTAPGSNFLDTNPSTTAAEANKVKDTLYNDFFQESSDGAIVIGGKRERSGLEMLAGIMQIVTVFVVVVGILFGLHVFIRSSQNGSFFENYSFLCPYLHYDINAPASEKGCKTIDNIQKEYTEKLAILQENIVTSLTEYIPIKVSVSILDASPEKNFIIKTYDNKPHINNVLEAFEKVKANSQSADNIECSGLTISNGNNLSTQCTVYGGTIGSPDTNGQIGSSRIQTLRFIENLSNTSKSSLILDNQPTSLGIEKISKKDSSSIGFSTRTTIPIQVRYVPLVQKL